MTDLECWQLELSSFVNVDVPILLLIASFGEGTCMALYSKARCLFSTQILNTVLASAQEPVPIRMYTGDILKTALHARGLT